MHKGFVALGAVLAFVAAILLIASLSGTDGANVAQTHSIPEWPSVLEISINTLGSASISVSWSGGGAHTQVYLAPCANSACNSPGTLLQLGAGASGSFSSSVASGTYLLWENTTGTTSGSLSGSYTVSGITLLLVLGFALLAVGALLLVVGFIKKTKPRAVYEDEESEQKFKIGPMDRGAGATGDTGPTTAPTPTAAVARPAPPVEYRPERAEPPRFMKATEPYEMNSPPPVPGSERAELVCTTCGTVNEPWITNCRTCKRPLSKTG
ncbi:MAG: hypothetical protein L3K13_04640 [Thermoplasmata archaeon]|nr:hypothetical protein [Thermoplasmata archaeon]